jgi:hypothetical protein
MLTRETVLRELAAAFSTTTNPGPEKLAPSSWDLDLERAEIRSKFGSREWQEFTIEELRFEESALTLSSAEGFCFLLPAFLRAALEEFEESDLNTDSIIYNLSPITSNPERLRKIIDRLSRPQRRVIADALELMMSENPGRLPNLEAEEAVRLLSQ